MAQRRKAYNGASTRASADATNDNINNPNRNTSDEAATASLLPAPQHPLYGFASNSPSRPSFTATSDTSQLQRRKKAEATSSFDRSSNTLAADKDKDWHGKPIADRAKATTTLDKLEGWFGLRDEQSFTNGLPTTSRNRVDYTSASLPRLRPKNTPRVTVSKSTRLVLVHVVTPTDSLEGLALRYNSDIRTLRRANGLWPGDSVLARKEIYIPVNEEAARGQGSAVIQEASEEASGKLNLLLFDSGAGGTATGVHYRNMSEGATRPASHTRSLSATSISSSGATSISHAQSASATMLDANGAPSGNAKRLSPPELRRIPANALSHFPPPGTTSSAPAVKDSDKSKGEYEYGMGLTSNDELQPGESGVEDLLQLAERARLRGSSDDQEESAKADALAIGNDSKVVRADELIRPSLESERDEAKSAVASSPSIASRALEEEWKPNKYTLGQRSKRHGASSTASQPNDEGQDAQDAKLPSAGEIDRASRSYAGWNDIPEPPLSKTAKGQVAHAYKNKRRYPRPGAVGIELPGSALMEDLAAGLPPNPGPAANWARPIGDSLPIAPSEDVGRGQAPTAVKKSTGSANTLGWGQILSDTVRGKMRLEDALGRGLEDIRAGLSSATGGANATSSASAPPPPPPNDRHLAARLGQSQQQRPSAEMARAALSDAGVRNAAKGEANLSGKTDKDALGSRESGGGIGNVGVAGGGSNEASLRVESGGPVVRRSSGRSLHELEDLRVQGDGANTHAYDESFRQHIDDREQSTGAQSRRNARNVDWLS